MNCKFIKLKVVNNNVLDTPEWTMSSNTSVESHIISAEQHSIPLNLMQQENHPINPLPLETIIQNPIPLSTSQTGRTESNPILIPSEVRSSPFKETPSAKSLLSLKSKVSANEILENHPHEPKILKVSKEDIQALCQVIREFKDQFVGM